VANAVTQLVIDRIAEFNRRDSLLADVEMPIKRRGNLRCVVVNPLVRFRKVDWQAFCERALATFNTESLDVTLKKQHTQRLLEHALTVSKGDYARRRQALLTLIETIENSTNTLFPGPRDQFTMAL
jgi:hypothetical protein